MEHRAAPCVACRRLRSHRYSLGHRKCVQLYLSCSVADYALQPLIGPAIIAYRLVESEMARQLFRCGHYKMVIPAMLFGAAAAREILFSRNSEFGFGDTVLSLIAFAALLGIYMRMKNILDLTSDLQARDSVFVIARSVGMYAAPAMLFLSLCWGKILGHDPVEDASKIAVAAVAKALHWLLLLYLVRFLYQVCTKTTRLTIFGRPNRQPGSSHLPSGLVQLCFPSTSTPLCWDGRPQVESFPLSWRFLLFTRSCTFSRRPKVVICSSHWQYSRSHITTTFLLSEVRVQRRWFSMIL